MASDTIIDFNDNKLRFPEDYRISPDINLISHDGTSANIARQVLDINIYESLYNNFLSGDITFIDTFGLGERLPIIGQELLEFKFRTPIETPGTKLDLQTYDFKKHKMFVYKISSRKKVNKGVVYTLEFTSYEGIKNNLVRISRAFDKGYDQAVADIFKKQWGLGSKKRLFIQPTKGVYKYVAPNMRPADVINYLASRAIPTTAIIPGYQFYENIQGFHFRSIESAYFVVRGGRYVQHPVVFEYFLDSAGQPSTNALDEPFSLLRRVYKFRFQPMYNTIENARAGTFSSTTITHDLYTKSFTTDYWNYAEDYHGMSHTSKGDPLDDSRLPYYGFVPKVPFDFHNKDLRENRKTIYRPSGTGTGYKRLTDYNDNKTILQSDTRYLHDTNSANGYELAKVTPVRNYARKMPENLQLIMEVPGNTGITVGNVIRVNVPRFSQSGEDTIEGTKQDKYLSEKWVISHIRHAINPQDLKHRTIITCFKETFNSELYERPQPLSVEVKDDGLPRDIVNDKTYT